MHSGSWIIAAAITIVGLLFIWMFRIEATYNSDGSMFLRNRITGHVELCNRSNECKTPAEWISSRKKAKAQKEQTQLPSTSNQPSISAEDKRLQDLATAQVVAELRKEQMERSIELRAKKSSPEKFLDIFYSFALGFVQPITTLWETLIGSRQHPYDNGLRDLWGLPSWIDQTVSELARQHSLNGRASNGGFASGIVFVILAALYGFKRLNLKSRFSRSSR